MTLGVFLCGLLIGAVLAFGRQSAACRPTDGWLLELARGGLADIAWNRDMTYEQVRHKAARVYRATDPGCDK